MFGISLSGLNASQKYLDVTSNNIANSNSYGFKKSRAEFADMYTNSVFTSSKTAVGHGTLTSTVSQQFAQGTLTGDTGNNLDMAIAGNGFFVLSNEPNANNAVNNGDRSYTRNGAFQLNSKGFIVTAQGDYLQGYDINDKGDATNLDVISTKAIQVPSTTGAPRASSQLSIGLNLPANSDDLGTAQVHAMTKFDPKDSRTYTSSTSQTIHDSLGGAHTLTYYFIKNNTITDVKDPNYGQTNWTMTAFVDGNPVDIQDGTLMEVTDKNSTVVNQKFSTVSLTFGPDGQLIQNGMKPGALYIQNTNSVNKIPAGREDHSLAFAMGGGVDDTQNVHIELGLTQYGSSSFTISKTPTDDGYATGQLTNVEVDENGVIVASYSNGRSEYLAKVALADFVNPQGLTKIGDTQWKESINSGQPRAMEANEGTAGAIKGANLENSNVDLSASLVDLIVAQRSYQANAQSLQTQNTVMDSILNVR